MASSPPTSNNNNNNSTSNTALSTRMHHPKNAKATTEVKEDPELWRDIQANVRKMDDLYDATFYTWLRSEDNVLVTASYLQRLAGEYDLDRIEHALCWLVNGWRLESIAILVKQVTFDWVVVKGDQGELNRAKLVLALTDNWAIQYIARLACTLLTSATVSSPPVPLLKFAPCHARMSSMPGSPLTSPTLSMVATMLGADGHTYGSRPSTPPLSVRSAASSPPSSPSSLSATSPVFSTFTHQPTHGRRMAVSRRLGSPMPMHASEDTTLQQGRPASVAGQALPASAPHRSGHFRQTSSTLPMQQRQQQYHTLHGTPSATSLHPSSTAASSTTAAPVYPSQQQASYHPHHCTLLHHHAHQQQQQHHPHRGVAHVSRSHGPHSHVRQQSQPGTISTSKQHWLQQQSSYSSSPVFYMNKSLFMEELSRKWSFCRLSEFFQCMDSASGISHRFKCKLLKESALKEELSQKQLAAKSAAVTLQQQQQQSVGQSIQPCAVEDTPLSPMDRSSAGDTPDVTVDVVMVESDPSESAPAPLTAAVSLSSSSASHTSSSAWSSSPTFQTMRQQACLHPFDNSLDTSATGASSSRTALMSAPITVAQLQQEQGQYHPLQSLAHGDYNDDMNSGLSRGCKSADGGHQHCRAQTVEAIMSGMSGPLLSTSSSSSSSSASSPTSTSAASASLSTLTLAESGQESASRPMSQSQSQQHHLQHQQSLSPFTSNYSSNPGLYRHAALSVPVTSSTMPPSSTSVAASSSATTLNVHATSGQRHVHDSTSTKRKNSLGVSLTPPSHCSSFSSTSSSSAGTHQSADAALSSSSAIFPGARRTSTSTSTTNEDLKRLRCSRQNSTSSTSGI